MDYERIEAELEALSRQYKSSDTVFSFKPRSSDLRVDDLSYKESEKLSVRSQSPMEKQQGSKAVAGAMKALQEKIRRLEGFNEKLQGDVADLQGKLATEKKKWTEQSHRDVEEAEEKEEIVLNRVRELEDELRKQKLKDVNVEEYVKSLTRQLQTMQEETEEEKVNADLKERALQERIDAMGKQIDQKNKEIQLLERNCEAVEKERSRLLSENTDLALELDRATSELNYLKQSGESSASDFLSKLHENEQKSARKLQESQSRVQDLELKNKHLSEMVETKEKQLEFLKQEIDSLKRANSIAESARMASLAESEKVRKFAYEMSVTNEKLTQSMRETGEKPISRIGKKAKIRTTSAPRPRSKSPSVPYRKSSNTSAEIQSKLANSENEINSRIAQLEREIARHNSEYRGILDRADSMELPQMRVELRSIAEEMEAKSRELSLLKRKQQATIRSQVRETM